jgi:hypothetical protein
MSDAIVNENRRVLVESPADERLVQAIVLLEDAFSFRSIAHKLSPSNIVTLYRWYWSTAVQRVLTLVVSVQLLLIFVQYPSSFSRTSDLRQERRRLTLPCSVQIALELVCLLLFYVDGIVRVSDVLRLVSVRRYA